MMRKANIRQYCVNCKYREKGGERAEKLLAEGKGVAHFTCYGYNEKGMKLNSMKEAICPMIRDAKENARKLDLELKIRHLQVCKRDIEALLEKKARLEKEIEELINS